MRRLALLVPLMVLVFLLVEGADREVAPEVVTNVGEESAGEEGRLVVLIIDSLRRATVEEKGVMPGLLELAGQDDVEMVDVTSCVANFTYPCLQTLFEGRQSPFVAGLHNFTGRESAGRSLPADLQARGRALGVASNISMVSLYGRYGEKTLNVEDWPISHLERDLRSVDVVLEWIEEDEVDDILLHLLGTDKAAHHELPGTDGYIEHFSLVDARSRQLIDALDLSRDHLVITGDHGHDEQGHHTRDTVAIVAGPSFTEFFNTLDPPEVWDQTELLYLMSLATGLELPLEYEGRHFLVDAELDDQELAPSLKRMLSSTREVLEAAGYDTDDLGAAIDAQRADLLRQHRNNLLAYLPLLALFLLWSMVIQGIFSGRIFLRQPVGVHLGLAALAVVVGIVSTGDPRVSAGLMALVAVAIVAWVRRHGGWRYLLWALVLLSATAAIGFYVREWADFFHTRGGFVPGQPIFYGALPVIGLALARLRYGRWRRAPEGAMAFALFCLPSGVYYYQFGQNMFWGFLLAGALVAAVVHLPKLRRRIFRKEILRWSVAGVAGVMAASAVLLLMQEAGGWEWQYFPIRWLERAGVVPTYLIFAGVIAYLAALMKGWGARIGVGVYLLACLVMTVFVGKMSIHHFVAAHTVVVFFASWLVMGRTPLRLSDPDRTRQQAGLVIFGAMIAMAWFLVRGFFLHNIDFHFGFEYFGDLSQDRYIFAGVFGVTMLKYGMPLCAILLVYRLLRGAEAFSKAADWSLFFCAFAMLALFTQILFSAVGSTEKLYELAVAQVVFVFILIIAIGAFSTAIGVVDRLRGRIG